jgi:hypothetical protein
MPKFTPKDGKNWGVEVNLTGNNGKPVYGTDGKIVKTTICMSDATLPNGLPQSLYFPQGHPRAGVFKGMAVILAERGLVKEAGLNANCKKFQCPEGSTNCCCRRVLYSQPDFANVPSALEVHCKARGFMILFLPKFHCELNFIEQCWGYAKRTYRHFPPSSKEADLELNVVKSLDAVPLASMRR